MNVIGKFFNLAALSLLCWPMGGCSVFVGSPSSDFADDKGSAKRSAQQEDFDDEQVVVPTSITGSYLACTTPTKATEDKIESKYGCGFRQEDGAPIALDESVDSWQLKFKSFGENDIKVAVEEIDDLYFPIKVVLSASDSQVLNTYLEEFQYNIVLKKDEKEEIVAIDAGLTPVDIEEIPIQNIDPIEIPKQSAGNDESETTNTESTNTESTKETTTETGNTGETSTNQGTESTSETTTKDESGSSTTDDTATEDTVESPTSTIEAAGAQQYWRVVVTSVLATTTKARVHSIKFKIGGEYKDNGETEADIAGYTGKTKVFSSLEGNNWGNVINNSRHYEDSARETFAATPPYDALSLVYFGVDFGEPVAVEGFSLKIMASSCPDAAHLEYSTDNTTWVKVEEASFTHKDVCDQGKVYESGTHSE